MEQDTDLRQGSFAFDAKSIAHREGLSWVVDLPSDFPIGDTSAQPASSTLVLFENDQPLGPSHSVHDDVSWRGGGAYSHWHNCLYFSTSDGSDPRKNGRSYVAFKEGRPELPQFSPEARKHGPVEEKLVRASTGWDDVLNAILFINRLGIHVRPEARMLDYGCGSGKYTYRMRDLGFDCLGFDIHDCVTYRSDSDRSLFAFSRLMEERSDYRLNSNFSIPFPDNHFDVIFSFSVLEHVQDLDSVLRECARVLKPTGIVVHFYPGKYQLIEPHIYIPLASFFSPRWWIRLWSRLGVRNEHLRHSTWQEAAEANLRYIETGLSYLGRGKIRSIAHQYFTQTAIYPSSKLYSNASSWQRVKMIAKAFKDPEPLAALGGTVLLQALVCDAKRC
jgi:SAM-dependent methyltransferase